MVFTDCECFFLGLTAFDFILDYDEWIESGYFSDEIRARLKGNSNFTDILSDVI